MSLLLIGDSNVERIWLHVKENSEHLRSATFVPVKRVDQLSAGFQAITASVSLVRLTIICYVLLKWFEFSFVIILVREVLTQNYSKGVELYQSYMDFNLSN